MVQPPPSLSHRNIHIYIYLLLYQENQPNGVNVYLNLPVSWNCLRYETLGILAHSPNLRMVSWNQVFSLRFVLVIKNTPDLHQFDKGDGIGLLGDWTGLTRWLNWITPQSSNKFTTSFKFTQFHLISPGWSTVKMVKPPPSKPQNKWPFFQGLWNVWESLFLQFSCKHVTTNHVNSGAYSTQGSLYFSGVLGWVAIMNAKILPFWTKDGGVPPRQGLSTSFGRINNYVSWCKRCFHTV